MGLMRSYTHRSCEGSLLNSRGADSIRHATKEGTLSVLLMLQHHVQPRPVCTTPCCQRQREWHSSRQQ